MDPEVWLPGLLVLGSGLLAGLLIAARLWRKRTGLLDGSLRADLVLRLADLEERRGFLYGRLQGSGPKPLTSSERTTLEEQAAHILRDIDQVSLRLADLGGNAPNQAAGGPETPPEGAVREDLDAIREKSAVTRSSRGALTGFASGLVVASLVGVLIYFAGRDAGPRPEMIDGEPASREQAPHPASEGLSALDEAQLDTLLAAVLSDPSALMRRKELALFQLSRNLFVEAFDQSREILAQSPGDPDGRYIQGVVRITMGQYAAAINLFDQVLADYPDHIQALLYRGIGLLQNGDRAQAIDTWEVALHMAGGSHPDIEYLLATATGNDGRAPERSLESSPEASLRPAAESEQESYQIQIAYSGAAQAARKATLFVFLKSGESGPPVAVKRISNPSFPLAVTLGAADTMINGTSLPSTGTLFVRLDFDGNASTKDVNDLEAQIAAAINTPTALELKP